MSGPSTVEDLERQFSKDDERNGIFALLSLSAGGPTHPRKGGSPGKRKRSQGALSPGGRARPGSESASPYRREMQQKLPEWVLEIQRTMERMTSGKGQPGQRDPHATPMSFITREFFYSETDAPWFREKPLVGVLKDLGLSQVHHLHRHEWWALLSLVGGSEKPRRLSEAFLHDSRMELQRYRDSVFDKGNGKVPFVVGEGVTAIHPVQRELHDGVILTLSKDACRVQFDKVDLGVHLVRTSDIAKKRSMSFVMPPLHYFMQQYVHSNTPSPQKPEDIHGQTTPRGGEERHMERVMGMIQHILQEVSQHQDADMIQQHVDAVFDTCVRIVEENKADTVCLLRPQHQSRQGSENNVHIREKVHSLLQEGLSNRIKEYMKVLTMLYQFPDVFDSMMDAMKHSS